MICLTVAAQAAPAVVEQVGPATQRTGRRKSAHQKRAVPPASTGEIVEMSAGRLEDMVKAQETTAAAAQHTLFDDAGSEDKYKQNRYFNGPLSQKGEELLARYEVYAKEARLNKQMKERQMHYADTIHIANHGQRPTKFPMITRISASVGAVAAVLNVFNTIVAAKTTHGATTPFSAPPTPPTLLDSAGRWDGKSMTLLKAPPADAKAKRGFVDKHVDKRDGQRPEVAKRWLLATGVGTAIGALFAPGFWGLATHAKSNAEKPPFDPYNPDILKQKDPLAVLATSPGKEMPQLDAVPAADPALPVAGSTGASGLSNVPASVNLTPVLQKRLYDEHLETLEKRQLVNGIGNSLWSKVAMAATAGSVIPLIYTGVAHARWRTQHPRDRDIIGDLDDTPTYGAVGVPNRTPGQLASYAMPGYTTYEQQMRAEQLYAQQKLVLEQQHKLAEMKKPIGAATNPAASETTEENTEAPKPVLSKRSFDSAAVIEAGGSKVSLIKRGKWVVGGFLAAIGLALGYVQAATQFPTDKDEEKDKKKKDAQKEALKQEQQQQQGGTAISSSAPSTMGGASMYSPQAADTPTQSNGALMYTPMQSTTGASAAFPASLVPISSNSGSAPASIVQGSPVLSKRSNEEHMEKRLFGMGSKAGRFLEVAGLTMFVGTLAANLMVSTKQQSKPVPYVTPNAGTKGPVPLGGDMYLKYLQSKAPTAQPQSGGEAPAAGVIAAAPVVPASTFDSVSNAASSENFAGSSPVPVLQKRRPFGTSLQAHNAPMLSKRLLPGFGLAREAAVIAESSAVRGVGVEAAGKAGAAAVTSEKVAGAGALRAAEAGVGASTSASAERVAAAEHAAGGMTGASEPALIRMPGFAEKPLAVGSAGLPALSPAVREEGLLLKNGAGAGGLPQYTAIDAGRVGAPVAGEAAIAPEAQAAKKGLSGMSKIGIVSTAAGVTMLANGAV